MTGPGPADPYTEHYWREFLTKGDPRERRMRRVFKHIPHGPRCQICAVPFGGIGAPLMRAIGKRRSEWNPEMCNTCNDFLAQNHGGAEIEGTFLFADIRGSTALAERIGSASFRDLLDRFYSTASTAVFAHEGMVDKFVGDELVAIFVPLLAGEAHATYAIDAARQLLADTGHPAAPWVPVGAGVHTGMAWVGAVGEGMRTEITALGDAVNTTARLASVAQAGEILVTIQAAEAAGLDRSLERRSLDLKGKELPTEVLVLRA
jgi:adenylate cyclase